MFNTMELLPSEAPIKFIYLGDTNRPTTEMGERRGCDSYWVVILIVLKIKYLDKNFVIIKVSSELMAL